MESINRITVFFWTEMRWLKRLVFLSLTVALTSLIASAQFRTTVGIHSSYDDNAFRNYLGQADYVAASVLSFEYQPKESNLTLFANGSVNLFKQYSDRRYFSNSLGLSYNRAYGEDDQNAWYAGASYFLRSNRQAYEYFDYTQAVGYVNVKHYLDYSEGILGKAGYRFRYRNYGTLEEFSYAEHYAFVQVSKFFETKTTVVAELDLGNKNYVSSNASTMNSTGMSGGMTGSGMMGRGAFMSYSSPSTTQLLGIVRVAQGLTSTTGLSLQYLRRIDLSERTRFLTGGGIDFQGDEELWDDPYGYQGHEYNATVTQLLPWDVSLRASVDYLDKQYARAVFLQSDTDVPTGPIRSDERWIGSIELKKKFDAAWGFANDLVVSLSYFNQRNQSNDPYYDFRSNTFSVGIQAQF